MFGKSRIKALPSAAGIAIALTFLGLATGVAAWAAMPVPYAQRPQVSAGPVVPAPRNHGYRQTRWIRWNGAEVHPPYPDYPQRPSPAARQPTPLQPEDIPAPAGTDESPGSGQTASPRGTDPVVPDLPLDDNPPAPPGDIADDLPPLPGESTPEPAEPLVPNPEGTKPMPTEEPETTAPGQPTLPDSAAPLFPKDGDQPDRFPRDDNLPSERPGDSRVPDLFDDPDSIFDDAPATPDQSRNEWGSKGAGKTIVYNEGNHLGNHQGSSVALPISAWRDLSQSQSELNARALTSNGWQNNPLRRAQPTAADRVDPAGATDNDQPSVPQWHGVRDNPLRP